MAKHEGKDCVIDVEPSAADLDRMLGDAGLDAPSPGEVDGFLAGIRYAARRAGISSVSVMTKGLDLDRVRPLPGRVQMTFSGSAVTWSYDMAAVPVTRPVLVAVADPRLDAPTVCAAVFVPDGWDGGKFYIYDPAAYTTDPVSGIVYAWRGLDPAPDPAPAREQTGKGKADDGS